MILIFQFHPQTSTSIILKTVNWLSHDTINLGRSWSTLLLCLASSGGERSSRRPTTQGVGGTAANCNDAPLISGGGAGARLHTEQWHGMTSISKHDFAYCLRINFWGQEGTWRCQAAGAFYRSPGKRKQWPGQWWEQSVVKTWIYFKDRFPCVLDIDRSDFWSCSLEIIHCDGFCDVLGCNYVLISCAPTYPAYPCPICLIAVLCADFLFLFPLILIS